MKIYWIDKTKLWMFNFEISQQAVLENFYGIKVGLRACFHVRTPWFSLVLQRRNEVTDHDFLVTGIGFGWGRNRQFGAGNVAFHKNWHNWWPVLTPLNEESRKEIEMYRVSQTI